MTCDPGPRPTALPVIPENIPAELRSRPQWVCWSWVKRKNKKRPVEWTKPPYQTNGRLAKANDPSTWTTFEAALTAYQTGGFDGLGYCLTEYDPFTISDFDNSRDPETGHVLPWAAELLAGWPSYAEFSPSTRGLRTIARGKKPGEQCGPKKCEAGKVEMYAPPTHKYLTFTGHRLPEAAAGIADAQEHINRIYTTVFETDSSAEGTSKPAPSASGTNRKKRGEGPWGKRYADLTDDDLLALGRAAENGEKFKALFDDGSLSYHADDPSRADAGLCQMLAFWCRRDAARIDRLFRRSALFRKIKWDERHRGDGATYGKMTVERAVERCKEVYDPAVRPTFKCTSGDESHSEDDKPPSGGCDSSADTTPPPPEWPAPPGEEAFHGLAGDFVRTLDPATEADPIALLVQLILGFGNLIGRTAYFVVEADRHYANEFAVLVGRSAKARKGTSRGRVRSVLEPVDDDWTANRDVSGLSSGEGLIWAVRDPIEKQERVNERGQPVRYETVVADPGEEDKRLMITEPEFANVLKQTERQGNTLSAILRQAWETGRLRSLTKNSPARATGAHVTIVGHITAEELRRYLTATETANGFANRFMWFAVDRSKLLPEGGQVPEFALAGLTGRLRAAADFARGVGEVRRDPEARELWAVLYARLSADRPGVAGALLARAEAHVLRLAMIYALLDKSAVIRAEHLVAAVALWDYAERSVLFVFGDATGDPLADDILRLLRASPQGLRRSDITRFLSNNVTAARLNIALGFLLRFGLAFSESRETGGRNAEWWFAGSRTAS
jgi:Protein of unknown function (DUF3987)